MTLGGVAMSICTHRAAALLSFFSALATLPALAAQAPAEPEPQAVTVAGSLQSELGCPGDWQPDCAASGLVFDPEDGIWQRVRAVTAGERRGGGEGKGVLGG